MYLTELIVPLILDKDKYDKGVDSAIEKGKALEDGLGNIAKISFAAVTTGILAIGGAILGASKLTFDWANNVDALGDVMGGTNEEMAAYAFTARKSGVDVKSFAQAQVILQKGLVKTDGSLDAIGETLNAYGIKVKDTNGQVKNQSQLTKDVTDKYAKLATTQEKINFLTDVYGKSGAQLIDFFDTLASDGGIDAVTKKVEAYGLAIDPSRYEQFNRNLEELKMIGTGVAVMFTEQLMPVFEDAMNWSTKFAQAPVEIKVQMVGDLFNNLLSKINEIDWGVVSSNVIARITETDWAGIGTVIRTSVGSIFKTISTVVTEIDWAGLSSSMGTAFSDLVLGLIDYPDWESFASDINSNVNHAFDYLRNYSMKDFQSDWGNFVDGLKSAWQGFISFIEASKAQAEQTGRNVTGGWNPVTAGGNGFGVPQHRVSGGDALKGQSYIVGEYRPEIFTPNQSGRISQVKDQPKMEIDYGKMGVALRDALLTSGALG